MINQNDSRKMELQQLDKIVEKGSIKVDDSPIVQEIGRGMENVGKSGLDQTPSWHSAQYQAQRGC